MSKRFRFSLRTLLLAMAVFACWLGWQLQVSYRRHQAREWIESQGGKLYHGDRMRLNFANDWMESHIWLPKSEESTDLSHIKKAFPESQISFHDSIPP